MAVRKRRGITTIPIDGSYTIKYWDADWNELEHLRAESIGPVSVQFAIDHWLSERDLIRLGTIHASPLFDAIGLSVEVDRGES